MILTNAELTAALEVNRALLITQVNALSIGNSNVNVLAQIDTILARIDCILDPTQNI